jgi:hypothetical protein
MLVKNDLRCDTCAFEQNMCPVRLSPGEQEMPPKTAPYACDKSSQNMTT